MQMPQMAKDVFMARFMKLRGRVRQVWRSKSFSVCNREVTSAAKDGYMPLLRSVAVQTQFKGEAVARENRKILLNMSGHQRGEIAGFQAKRHDLVPFGHHLQPS